MLRIALEMEPNCVQGPNAPLAKGVGALHSDEKTRSIPPRAHFVWFGERFPWVNVLAVKSAALRGGFDEIILHHDSDLSATPHYQELIACPRVTLRRLEVPVLLARCTPFTVELSTVYERLRTPATRSDLARFALLYSEGGVYLDIDTVTVADFGPLLPGVDAFCGRERIVYPAKVKASRNPFVITKAVCRSLLRDVWRRWPRGYRYYQKFQSLYPAAENPAILGGAARSPFMTAALREMIKIPPERQALPCELGPHLLQHLAPLYSPPELVVHEPEVFFPLGPEISEHWFRFDERISLADVISPNTRLVHWYASVRTKHIVPEIDPAYVRKHASHQLFSALALPFVD